MKIVTLIDMILDQYERREAKYNKLDGNSSLRIQEKEYKIIEQQDMVMQAKKLEEAKLIKIVWVDGYYNVDIEKIKYPLANMLCFYKLANRVPKYVITINQKNKALDYYRNFQKSWIRNYMEAEVLPAIERGNIAKDDKKQMVLYECLVGLDQLNEPVLKRVFSKRILHDSKRFEKELQAKIIRIAKKYLEDIDMNMEKQDILNQLFIEEYAQELYIKGRLFIELEGKRIDTGNFFYGTILNTQTMKKAIILSNSHIRKIITIENKANFIAEPYDDNTLIIFTHGYFSPLERRFLSTLNQKLQKQIVSYLHSGDLDYGGVCIFKFIQEKIFPDLMPLNMDKRTFNKYLDYAEDMKDSVKNKLRKLKVPQLDELIVCMLESGKSIEQEAFL